MLADCSKLIHAIVQGLTLTRVLSSHEHHADIPHEDTQKTEECNATRPSVIPITKMRPLDSRKPLQRCKTATERRISLDEKLHQVDRQREMIVKPRR